MVTWYLKDGYNFGVQAMGRLAWPCREASTVQDMRGKRWLCFWWDFLMAKQGDEWGGSVSWGM